ncbi:MAG: hypothetical protein JWL81_2633 [Verrucomicrobiales bacterium]|nr:hypothetical protein [Verrucomicrobiales bacterium]
MAEIQRRRLPKPAAFFVWPLPLPVLVLVLVLVPRPMRALEMGGAGVFSASEVRVLWFEFWSGIGKCVAVLEVDRCGRCGWCGWWKASDWLAGWQG